MAAPAQTVRLVMCDLDGTLIDTAPEIADAVNDTLAQCALPLVTSQQVRDWIGHGTRTLFNSPSSACVQQRWSAALVSSAIRQRCSAAGLPLRLQMPKHLCP